MKAGGIDKFMDSIGLGPAATDSPLSEEQARQRYACHRLKTLSSWDTWCPCPAQEQEQYIKKLIFFIHCTAPFVLHAYVLALSAGNCACTFHKKQSADFLMTLYIYGAFKWVFNMVHQ